MAVQNDTLPGKIQKIKGGKKKKNSSQYYTIGEILLDLGANPENASQFFENKVVLIGNFGEDIHSTPVGKMSGPVILANIYLSLLNQQHIVSLALVLMLFIAFSILSYVAWFGKMPVVRLNEDVFPTFVAKFVRKYVTYFGCMFFLSLLSLFCFQIQVPLFIPALLFAEIEMRHKTKENIIKTFAFYKNKYISIRNYFRTLLPKS